MILTQRAPAKVNLFLDVVKKRKDGYHDILTLFLKIGLFDTLRFRPHKDSIRISCAHPQIPDDETNLVYKAADLLRRTCRFKGGARIEIQKKIPVGAGLGGGSSDAAAALVALNKLWKLKLDVKKLKEIAVKIGADVPFFIGSESAAFGRGKGEILRPFDLGRKFWILLVCPDIFVSTKEIYQSLGRCLTKKKIDVKLLSYAFKNGSIEEIGKKLYNRLELVTFRKHKKLAEIKDSLSALGVRAVLMSGSGSAIFGLTKSREEAVSFRCKLRDSYKVMVVRSL